MLSNSTQRSQLPQALINQIISFYNQGELKEAVLLAESSTQKYPNALILYEILGAAYLGLEDTNKTIISYQKVLQINPRHTDAYNNMGMALYHQGRFDEAAVSYQKALEIEPDSADGHYNLGNALKQMGDLQQAIESYKASIVSNPRDAEVLFNYGNTLKAYGDFDQAIEVYAKSLKIKPDFSAAKKNMHNAFEKKEEISKLVAEYARLADLALTSAEAISFKGTLLKTKGYLEVAIDSHKKALMIKPDYAEAYCGMGVVLKEKGDLDAAIDSYRKALKIDPTYAEVHNNMGNVLSEKGELDAAIKSYKQALKIKPDYAEAVKNLVKVPFGSLKKEDVKFIKNLLNKFEKNFETISDREFFKASFLMHSGDIDLAFNKFSTANEIKALTFGDSIKLQENAIKNYSKKVKIWKPNITRLKQNSIKKLFILGPSRSGKSSLEEILAQSLKVKRLFEANRKTGQYNLNSEAGCQITFEKLFFERESNLLKKGYEVVTSTNPHLLLSIIDVVEEMPNSYFVFIDRETHYIAPDIFSRDYKSGNYYAYDPFTILKYINFYKNCISILEKKIPKNLIQLSFDQIKNNPNQVINNLSSFISVDFNLSESTFEEKKLMDNNIFYSHFQNIIKPKKFQ